MNHRRRTTYRAAWPLFYLSATVPALAQPSTNALPLRRQPVLSDTLVIRRHYGAVEVGGLASSTDATPFWVQTNQFGIIPKTAPTGLLIGTVASDYRHGRRAGRPRVDWGYGLNVVGQLSAVNRVVVGEAYGKVRLGAFEVWGGRRRQLIGLAESRLSSGAYILSGNALPIPQVQVAIPDYVPIGFTNGWVSFKGLFAHGWFGQGAVVRNSYLHHKALFVRLGPAHGRIRLYGAFTHHAQWAGYAQFLETDNTSSFSGQMADSFVAYMNVVVPLKTDALKNRAKFTTYDQNRVGDHRGSAEASIEYRFGSGTLTHYQQHFYDLGRKLYNLRNIEDGLYGLRYVNHRRSGVVNEAVVELFNSGSQGVVQFGQPLGGEWEGYFINGQYPEGWSYQGRTIGTPLLSQTTDTDPRLPALEYGGYTLDGRLISGRFGINNSRVWAVHTGIGGSLGRHWGYVTKLTYSRNYGSFNRPFPPNITQFSGLLSITHQARWLANSTLLVSAAYDQGRLLRHPRQLGGYVGWRKAWPAARR